MPLYLTKMKLNHSLSSKKGRCDWYAKVVNLQLVMIEIYKTKHSLNPTFMRDVFAERNNQHNLRNENHLRLPVAKTTTYGLETIEYRGCLLWSTLPPEIKDSKSLSEFKRKIKKWDGNSCLCRLCKIYVRNLRFL